MCWGVIVIILRVRRSHIATSDAIIKMKIGCQLQLRSCCHVIWTTENDLENESMIHLLVKPIIIVCSERRL